MNAFVERLNAIYTKKKINIPQLEHFELIPLIKWLSLERDNLPYLAHLLDYRWNIDTKHFFYLLFFWIPRKAKAPYHRKIEKFDEKTNKLLDKIKYVNSWSTKELQQNLGILEKVVLTNVKYWESQLAVK